MRAIGLASFFCFMLLLLPHCDGQEAKTIDLKLDPCIAKVKVTIKPGAPESQEVTLKDGTGRAEFETIDFEKDVEVRIEVLDLKPCEQNRFAKGDFLIYGKSKLPGNHVLTPRELDKRYRPQIMSAGGKVAAGECPTSRGPGIGLFVMDRDDCRKTCWQQWAKLRWFLVGSPDTELGADKPFKDSAGHEHIFGKFGRDIPDGSNGNCFREDQIPGQSAGSKGIVDAPNYPDDANLFGFALRAARKIQRGTRPPFSVRFEFAIRSVLWCEDPGPRILGYYTWNAKQTFDFAENEKPPPNVSTTRHTSEVDKNPAWKDGSDGLEDAMKNH